MKYLKLHLLTMLLAFVNLHAQSLHFSHLGVERGLSQSSVYTIFQDSRGFMWFGTGDGLNKYDGVQVITYRHNNDLKPLSNFFTEKIVEDQKGNLWIGSRKGLSKYDYAKDRLEHVFSFNDSLNNRWIDMLGIDKNQHLWFWDRHRNFYSYDQESRKYKIIKIKEGTGIFRQAYFDKAGCIWYNSIEGLCRYQLETQKFEIFMQEYFNKKNITSVSSFVLDDSGLLWIAGFNDLMCFNTRSMQLEKIPQELEAFNFELTVITYYKDFLWLGSLKQGMAGYDKKNKKLLRYRHDPFNTGSIATDNITAMFIDRSGNFWVATDGFGLNLADLKNVKFPWVHQDVSSGKRNFSSNFIKSFYEDPLRRIWIGTYNGGINILDRKENTVLVLKTGNESGNSISGFIKDMYGHLLIATDNGVECIDEVTFKRTPVPFEKDASGNGTKKIPYGFCKTKEGILLVATSKGLYEGVYSNDVLVFFKGIPATQGLVLGCVFQTSDGRIMAAAMQGGFLHVFRIQNNMLVYKENLLEGTGINSFYEDISTNILWMGSDNGLIQYNLKTGNSTFRNEQDGLGNNHIYGLLCDSKNRIWMSTNKGLSCYEPASKQFRNYDVDDGLQSNEFNTGAFFKSNSGELFFGGINGFNAFYPESVKDNPNRPLVALCHLMINDDETKAYGNPSCIRSIELAYSENTVSFDFSALEFTRHDKNQYRYRLLGTDKEWVNAGNKHFARYSNLTPGKYRFIVMASNNDGLWGDEQQLCSIMIQPPWWRTWWAIGLLSILMLLSTYWILRNVIDRKLKKQQRIIEKQKALEEERNRISKDMHDDLGSGLSKIAIMSELLKGSINDKNGVEAIGKISRTANELVDNMSQIIWAMNPDNDHIENILGYLRKFTLDFFEDSPVRCELKFNEVSPALTLTQSARRNLFLVIKETFHNILKHSQADEIYVEMHSDSGKLKVIIRDNGKGFDIDKHQFTGNGLNNMKKRMSAINGDYEILSEPGKGTETILGMFF